MKTRVCDLCEERSPDAKIKYRYKAKRRWYSWYEKAYAKYKELVKSKKENKA